MSASAFVDTSRVAVTADGEIDPKAVTPDMDVIYIRKKMDFGTKQRVISAAMKIAAEMGKGKTDAEPEAAIDVGAWQLALAQHNILDWSGPAFGGLPCTAKNIARLDPAFPVLQRALACISERNQEAAAEAGGEPSDPKA
jgi:hypothetical protein